MSIVLLRENEWYKNKGVLLMRCIDSSLNNLMLIHLHDLSNEIEAGKIVCAYYVPTTDMFILKQIFADYSYSKNSHLFKKTILEKLETKLNMLGTVSKIETEKLVKLEDLRIKLKLRHDNNKCPFCV